MGIAERAKLLELAEDVARNISYKSEYWFDFKVADAGVFFEVKAYRLDCVTGEKGIGRGGWHYIRPDSIEQQIVQQMWGALQAYEIHESREFFTYKGKRIFGPHIALDALMEIADRTTY